MRRGLDGFTFFWPACSFQASSGPPVPHDFGGHSEGETPLPIPNRAVKPLSADGTWWATAWESRSPPVLSKSRPSGRLFFVRNPTESGGGGASGLRRVAVHRGAEVRAGWPGAGEAPLGMLVGAARIRLPPSGGRDVEVRCPTGAAGGPRRRLPSGPAIGSGMPVGPSASGPLRAGLEAILAKRGEVEYEVDTVDDSLAKVVAPVEHGPQTMDALGRNICSARDVAEALGDGPETA
jgi:hypothetical protein